MQYREAPTDEELPLMAASPCPLPARIRSGGQTGVDRAALDWAIANGIPHAGWCPRGRLANDGPLPSRYQLQETPSAGWSQRTRLNVRDADATLILHAGPLQGGTRLTLRLARQMDKPVHLVDLLSPLEEQIEQTRRWWQALGATELNVAGPSEEREPGVYGQGFEILACVWGVMQAQVHQPINKIF